MVNEKTRNDRKMKYTFVKNERLLLVCITKNT